MSGETRGSGGPHVSVGLVGPMGMVGPVDLVGPVGLMSFLGKGLTLFGWWQCVAREEHVIVAVDLIRS